VADVTIDVRSLDDAGEVLAAAGPFLASEPVLHNVVLTLLHARVATPEVGRYWVAGSGRSCVGVGFQSPLHFVATLTPMPDEAVLAMVDAVVASGVRLPGVSAVAATAARFAGHWAERTKEPAVPVQGQRIYEVEQVRAPVDVPGRMRVAEPDDHAQLVEWLAAFGREAGGTAGDAATVVRARTAAGQLVVWERDGPAAMAGVSDARAGVARIGPVYTPPEGRGRGSASALVAELSASVRAAGHRCILYTDLANPVSNSIYRSIGYEARAEVLRYDFRRPDGSELG
jgi:predicted GNAT family acetyltransferase